MKQLFSKYKLVLKKLTLAIDLLNLSYEDDELFPEEIDDIIQESVIKRFEYNYDLAFLIMKNILDYQGIKITCDFENVVSEAFKIQLIDNLEDVETWLEMKKMREISINSYESEIAEGLSQKIISEYHQLFIKLKNIIEKSDLFDLSTKI